jgi:hypothetical protein
LLHDATEALLGGFDPITPIKSHLGEGYEALVTLHQAALDTRYALPPWDDQSYRAHKCADHLAAASEGLHVVGWSRKELRDDLEIALDPLNHDPVAPTPGFAPWEPWPAAVAAERFLEMLAFLSRAPAEISPCAHPKAA